MHVSIWATVRGPSTSVVVGAPPSALTLRSATRAAELSAEQMLQVSCVRTSPGP